MNRYKILIVLMLILGFFLIPNLSFGQQNINCGVYFTGVGCPHCAKADPVVLQQAVNKYPNLVIIEYEIYQQTANASLLDEYHNKYDSPLGVPITIFDEQIQVNGDRSILNNLYSVINSLDSQPCPLITKAPTIFETLNINNLPGYPKIWNQQKILIKTDLGDDNQSLKNLLITEDLGAILKEMEFTEIQPAKVPLSGQSVKFDHAIKFKNWVFQWDGKSLEELLAGEPSIPDSEDQQPSPSKSPQEGISPKEPEQTADTELTLAKVLSLAAIDAINPCALAVLVLMLIAILSYNPGKKKKLLLAGLAFVVSVFVMYLIYGLVIIKSFQLIQALTSIRIWLYKILGLVAVVLGVLKLRDFVCAKSVCKMNPRVNKIVSKITSPRGAFLVGAFVTIFLLPCTIGPYIICGGILSAKYLLEALPYLLAYNLVFILPMLAVVLIIYLGLSKVEDISAWQAKHMKYLDLVAGLIILLLGIAMILGWV